MRLAILLMLVIGCRPASRHIAPPVVPLPPEVAVADDHALARLAAAHRPSRLDEVARVAAGAAGASYVVSAAAVKAAMATALGSGVWPYVLTGWGTDDEIAAQLEAGLTELRAVTELAEIGFATASGPAGHVGVIVAVPPPSLPLTVERSGSLARLSLAWVWGDAAAVYAVTPKASHRLDATRTGDQIELAIDCADPVAIEIRAGARVIATVVDACAPELAIDELPPALDLGPPAHTAVEIEMRVWALINRERVAHGVAAVAWDAAGHRFARGHAADMARLRYVGHEAPNGASYRERIAGAPFRSLATHENVGHAWGPGEVHEAFLRSAGHRANLLADDVDRGAVGIAIDPLDPGAFYVSEFFRR
jgi:cysteine-rich secretory family protein